LWGCGIKAYEVVLNFRSHGRKLHFVDDQDSPPVEYAEQFADRDPAKALSGDDLLRQARMILSMELGIDPLLRQGIRTLFKNHAQITVEPTERGKNKIDEYHPYHVSSQSCHVRICD
jgi:transcription elongation factor SPT6